VRLSPSCSPHRNARLSAATWSARPTDRVYRALDQPVCGLQRRGDRTTLYVQREVPGIYGENQDCCHKPLTRLEAIDVSRWVNHKE
jgi:hypothetical protein